MPAELLTNGEENVFLVKKADHFLLYKLEGRESYFFDFYGSNPFEMVLDEPGPILEQPYGRLGASRDLTGRLCSSPLTGGGRIVQRSGKIVEPIKCPIYSFLGEYNPEELSEFLEGFCLEMKDVPYASITTSSTAVSEPGDDLYVRTLFFMTGGYGLLTEIAAVAGRSLEDCCSPEYQFVSYKIKLDEPNPLQIVDESDMCPGAAISYWTLSANPKIVQERQVMWNCPEGRCELEKGIDELYSIFSPVKEPGIHLGISA